jgi:protein PhnA
MKLKRWPELHSFLSTCFSDGDAGVDANADLRAAESFASSAPLARRQGVAAQGRALLSDPDFPLEELGTEANRWFGDTGEARDWLKSVLGVIESSLAGESAEGSVQVKDSNGAVLSEGDTVQVIKDLKVRGGSSDLKRGTTIKKIHLIDDPEAIECRVEGSTLVLKTCFLKKV